MRRATNLCTVCKPSSTEKKASALSLLDISICDSYLLHIWSQGSGVRGSDGGGGGIDREDNVFFFRDGEGAASVGVGSFCWFFVGWPGLGKGEKERTLAMATAIQ